MAPHLIWAGVVLLVAWMGYQVNKHWMVRSELLERMERRSNIIEDQLADLKKGHDKLRGEFDTACEADNATICALGTRVARLEPKLAELEPLVKSLSAPPKSAPQVRRI